MDDDEHLVDWGYDDEVTDSLVASAVVEDDEEDILAGIDDEELDLGDSAATQADPSKPEAAASGECCTSIASRQPSIFRDQH